MATATTGAMLSATDRGLGRELRAAGGPRS